MKRLKNLLNYNNSKTFFLFILFFIILKNSIPVLSFISLLYIYYFLTKDKSIICLGIAFLLILIHFYNTNEPNINSGRVIEKENKYIVIRNGNTKVIVYTEDDIPYDAIINFKGDFKEIEESYGFYNYSFKESLNKKGIYYSLDLNSYKIVKQYPTLRYLLELLISKHSDNIYLKQFIFGINTNDNNEFLSLYGFSYYGIIVFSEYILGFIIDEEKNKKIINTLYVLLLLLYHFPFILLYRFIISLLKDNNTKWLFRSLILIIFKDLCITPIFIIPLCYTIFSFSDNHFKRIYFQAIISSILFDSINILIIYLYKFLLIFRGLAWWYSLLVLFLNVSINPLIYIFNYLNDIYNIFNLSGNIFGFGLLFYILLISFFNNKNKYMYRYICLIIFQLLGLFHPLSEVTFINVGQGDAILIRESFNRNNILIDTGKSNQYNSLKAYLKGKGITKINALFISHHDSDHDGNMNEVINKYNCNEYIDKHFKEMNLNNLLFYDLNDIDNEDKNESSLVLYTEINSLKFLFMGDASKYTETRIIRKYNDLKCDILKLSHHGSDTGSDGDFLDAIKPSIGIISSGKYNLYHHPNINVIDRLNKRNIKYLDTKEEGDISIFFLNNINILLTSNKTISIMESNIDG